VFLFGRTPPLRGWYSNPVLPATRNAFRRERVFVFWLRAESTTPVVEFQSLVPRGGDAKTWDSAVISSLVSSPDAFL